MKLETSLEFDKFTVLIKMKICEPSTFRLDHVTWEVVESQ